MGLKVTAFKNLGRGFLKMGKRGRERACPGFKRGPASTKILSHFAAASGLSAGTVRVVFAEHESLVGRLSQAQGGFGTTACGR